jgi:signal peptidase
MKARTSVRRLCEAAIALAVLAVVLGSVLGQPILLGFVETGSMEPTLSPGDGFVAVPTPAAGAVDEGDVVTFRGPDGLTTHRVVDERAGGFVTRGDANPFTDQQDGDPVVSREDVVAVALSVDGGVVALPGVGAVVGALRGALGAVGSALGVGDDPGQLATVLFATTVSAFLLDELLAESEGTRSEERSIGRADGYDVRLLVAAGVLVAVVAATTTMMLATGGTTVGFDSVSPGAADQGGIVAGESSTVGVSLSNAGALPSVAVVEAPGPHATVPADPVVLGPRGNATVNATLSAPAATGRYEAAVVQYRYVGVLPPAAIRWLHDVDPWVARGAIDAVLALGAYSVTRLVLGQTTGRLRLESSRTLPVGLSLRRRLRQLYR